MKNLLSIILFAIPLMGLGQTNLFPNPSFEQYTDCPDQDFNISTCVGYYNPTNNSPDYLNECADTFPQPHFWALPHSSWGYQFARTGQGCAGFATWGLLTFDFNVRDYIEGELSDTLHKDSIYHLSFYVNLANNQSYSTYGCVGAYFSKEFLFEATTQLIPVTPQVYNPFINYIMDTLGWTLVEGDYTAQGGERYVTFGNFFDDITTQFIKLDTTNQDPYFKPYFFIDDLSLVLKSSLSVNATIHSDFKIYPNPANFDVTITLVTPSLVIVTDDIGRVVYQSLEQPGDVKLLTNQWAAGLYVIAINNGYHQVDLKKLIVQH